MVEANNVDENDLMSHVKSVHESKKGSNKASNKDDGKDSGQENSGIKYDLKEQISINEENSDQEK